MKKYIGTKEVSAATMKDYISILEERIIIEN